MAPSLLRKNSVMSTALELVYQYRQLAGKRDTCGLTMDDIDLMTTIESLFRSAGAATTRRFDREPVDLVAVLRARGCQDPIHIGDLAPGGLVCTGAPYVEPGDVVEIVIDDAECSVSYRFKAKVTRLEDEPDGDFTLGLAFVGAPLLLRYSPSGRKALGRRRTERDGIANAA